MVEVLDALDAVARQLLPGWLPEVAELDGPQGAALAAIRAVAVERARVAGYSSAFLADLAERALTGRPSQHGCGPRRGSRGSPASSRPDSGRDRLVLVMATRGPGKTSAGDVVVAGSEWLADRGGLGVWLTGAGSPGPERIGTVPMPAA